MQGYTDHEELGSHDKTKDTNKAPGTDPKEMEIHEPLDREFKIIILK